MGWASRAAAFGLFQFSGCCVVIQFSCQTGENAVWIDRASQELIFGYQTQDSSLGQRQHHHRLGLGPRAGKTFHALHHPAELQHLQEGERKGSCELVPSSAGTAPSWTPGSHRLSGLAQSPARSPGISIHAGQAKFHSEGSQKAATGILLSPRRITTAK